MSIDTEVMDLDQITTPTGTIHVADTFYDLTTEPVQWVRVDRIDSDRYGVTAYCTVLDQHGDPYTESTEKKFAPARLLGPGFIRATIGVTA